MNILKKIILILIVGIFSLSFYPFTKKSVDFREEFLAKLTFDLFQYENKKSVFDKKNITLTEGLFLFEEALSFLHKEDNIENYKKYQDVLKSLLVSYFLEKN